MLTLSDSSLSSHLNDNPPHGSFHFSSPSYTAAGDQHRRGNHGNPRGRDLGDQSKPIAEPVVGSLDRQAITGGGEEANLAVHFTVAPNSSAVPGRSGSATVGKKDVGYSSFPTTPELSEDEVGGVATLTDINASDTSFKGDDGANGMEFDGGGEAAPTI